MSIVVQTGRAPVEILRPADLAERGVTEWAARRQVTAGAWTRLRPGYLVARPAREFYPDTFHALQVFAGLDAVRGPWVASHWSAALLHGIALHDVLPAPVALSRPAARGRVNETNGTTLFWTRLDEREIGTARGLPVTAPSRTVVDLACRASVESAVVAMDSAIHKGLTSMDEISAAVSAGSGRTGIGKARAALAQARVGAESPYETLSRLLMARSGIPEPILQHPIADERGHIFARADFYWPDGRLIGEVDGASKYRDATGAVSQSRFDREKVREQELADLGYDIIRWRATDLRDPELLADRILNRLAMRCALLGRPSGILRR